MRKSVFINKGFTMYEIMVVLAVMSILSVLLLVKYRQGQNQYVLDQAAQRLAADLRQVQVMAVTGANPTEAVSVGGYGIKKIDSDTYALFLNDDSDVNGCPIGDDSDLENGAVDLPSGIAIASDQPDIFFAPPQPKTCIGRNNGNEEITFTLSRSGSSDEKTVNVTKTGKIEVQ